MRKSVFILSAIAIAAPAFAQPASNSFVLSERGINVTALANLTVGNDGSVTGTEVQQQAGSAVTYAVQGALTDNNDGTSTLVLNGTSTDTVDANGGPLASSETLKLVPLAAGGYAAMRTDPGQYAYAELSPAASVFAPGAYIVNRQSIDLSAVSVDRLAVDAAGTVGGSRIENSFGTIAQEALAGSNTTSAGGFYSIQLQVSSTDADGNAATTNETYFALPTAKDVRMIRLDHAAGLLILTK